MIDNKPTYTVRIENTDGVLRYYAAFTDGDGHSQEVEISHAVYLVLEECRRHEQRQARSDERHEERYALSEGQLAERLVKPPQLLEDSVVLAADMQAALATLTDTQRRRFLLYQEHNLSFEQIAIVEGCTHPAVLKALAMAQEKLKKYFSGEGYKTGV